MLSKKEIGIIHQACEQIETNHEAFSCCAISNVQGTKDLRYKYAAFYDLDPNSGWDIINEWTDGARKQHRILLMLLFAEVGAV